MNLWVVLLKKIWTAVLKKIMGCSSSKNLWIASFYYLNFGFGFVES
jgi:hypothetical protein